MTNLFPISEPCRGRISQGPSDLLVERTLNFVHNELATWRDDPDRGAEDTEELLNAQLCKYLNVAASHRFPMVHFSHEERQTGIRRVDMSALPRVRQFVSQTYHTIYDPFLVFEGKRLPAPSSRREREYVTGGAERSGGIQRFKLALHGAKQTTAAMIGYVQKGELKEWLLHINDWISQLASDTASSVEIWFIDEQLTAFAENYDLRVSSASSLHKRIGIAISPEIRLRHLWVLMQN